MMYIPTPTYTPLEKSFTQNSGGLFFRIKIPTTVNITACIHSNTVAIISKQYVGSSSTEINSMQLA
jgi:hypothetical protein